MNRILINDSKNPWHNLAVEELLFSDPGLDDSCVTLFLWQNQRTVVIGKHQNAWNECRCDILESEGGRLARRKTGGGAVFHDVGNLNFTFIAPRRIYDQTRQLRVITQAISALGIPANFTGRNDIVLKDGSKFSGNAFRFSKARGLHHGTILISADMSLLARYLLPSAKKLQTHAVKSVSARVKNLNEIKPDIDLESVRDALIKAFTYEYGPAISMYEDQLDRDSLVLEEELNASWDWLYGQTPEFDIALSRHFSWGAVDMYLKLKKGRVSAVKIYSDAMDDEFITALSEALENAEFKREAVITRIQALDCQEASQLCDWIAQAI